MSDKKRFFDLLNQTLQAYHPFYLEDVIKWRTAINIPDNWFSLNAVRANEPGSFKVADLNRMNPYTALDRQEEVLDGLVKDNCLIKKDDGSYHLTDLGREIIEEFFSIARQGMAGIEPISLNELHQLKDLLERLVTAVENADEPAEKLGLDASRWTDPGPNVAPSVSIDQSVTDLLQFRDDAHRAAWQRFGISGRTWETLTFIWRQEANSPSKLVERLPFRGYTESDYAESFQELEKLGWIVEKDGVFEISKDGEKIREEAEVDTDRIYYEPWSTLDESEMQTLELLLQNTVASLNHKSLLRFWPLLTEVSGAITPVTRDAVQERFQSNFSDPAIFFPLLLALGNDPEPISTELYRKRFPYAKAEQIESRYQIAVSEGKLFESEKGSYLLTENGKKALASVNDVFYRKLGEIDPLSGDESAALETLLAKLVDASLKAEIPEEKWAIVNMHNCHPSEEYPSLAKIDQHIDDLNAFRDDAHIAAWEQYAIDARTWESMTYIWRGDATSASDLAEALEFRGYSEDELSQSLHELEERGWIRQAEDGLVPTDKGKHIRQEAEENTNSIFYAPWESLEANERSRLYDLLARLKIGLEALVTREDTL